ncbi:MAG: hypothetical protein ACJ74T_09115 [Pyrinomonadaceae bacterium]
MKTLNRDEESLRELKETEGRLKELCLWSRQRGWTWQAVGIVSGLRFFLLELGYNFN